MQQELAASIFERRMVPTVAWASGVWTWKARLNGDDFDVRLKRADQIRDRLQRAGE